MKQVYFILILISSIFFSNQVISADNWQFAYPIGAPVNVVNNLNEVPMQLPSRPRRGCIWRLENNEELQNMRENCEIKIQEKQYLGKILGPDYKKAINELPSQHIKGFFIKILRQKINNQIVPYDGEEIVYLPYVVILKKDLVADLSVRNSGGTLLSNLAINREKLIEFDKLSTFRHEIKDFNTQCTKSYFLISARPVESEILS